MSAPYQMRKPWADNGTSTGRLMLASNEEEDLGAHYGSIKRKLERVEAQDRADGKGRALQ